MAELTVKRSEIKMYRAELERGIKYVKSAVGSCDKGGLIEVNLNGQWVGASNSEVLTWWEFHPSSVDKSNSYGVSCWLTREAQKLIQSSASPAGRHEYFTLDSRNTPDGGRLSLSIEAKCWSLSQSLDPKRYHPRNLGRIVEKYKTDHTTRTDQAWKISKSAMVESTLVTSGKGDKFGDVQLILHNDRSPQLTRAVDTPHNLLDGVSISLSLENVLKCVKSLKSSSVIQIHIDKDDPSDCGVKFTCDDLYGGGSLSSIVMPKSKY